MASSAAQADIKRMIGDLEKRRDMADEANRADRKRLETQSSERLDQMAATIALMAAKIGVVAPRVEYAEDRLQDGERKSIKSAPLSRQKTVALRGDSQGAMGSATNLREGAALAKSRRHRTKHCVELRPDGKGTAEKPLRGTAPPHPDLTV